MPKQNKIDFYKSKQKKKYIYPIVFYCENPVLLNYVSMNSFLQFNHRCDFCYIYHEVSF